MNSVHHMCVLWFSYFARAWSAVPTHYPASHGMLLWAVVSVPLVKYVWTAAALAMVLLVWMFVLWRFPLFALRLDEKLNRTAAVKSPWLLGIEIPLRYFLLLAFFDYSDRVLDAWVSKHFQEASNNFADLTTVRDRTIYYDRIPAYVNGKGVSEISPEELKNAFALKRCRILVFGEGGIGKTSLACAIARWATLSDRASCLTEKGLLPVIIEDDLTYRSETVADALLMTVRDRLAGAVDADDAPSCELILHLLRRQRILLIIDGLSELSENTRASLNFASADFPASLLIVTSRSEEDIGPSTLEDTTDESGGRYAVRVYGSIFFSDWETAPLHRQRILRTPEQVIDNCSQEKYHCAAGQNVCRPDDCHQRTSHR